MAPRARKYESSSPCSLKEMTINKITPVLLDSCKMVSRKRKGRSWETVATYELDDIIFAKKNDRRRNALLERLKELKHLCQTWFGSSKSLLRQELLRAFSDTLYQEQPVITPAYELLIQLLFGISAGKKELPRELSSLPQRSGEFLRVDHYSRKVIDIQFNRHQSMSINSFLEELAPYGIQELNTLMLIFANKYPLLTIVKNSPNLKYIHLYNHPSPDVFLQLADSCKKLHVIRADILAYPSYQFLYKTFFGGMDSVRVHKAISSGTEVKKSFQFLKGLQMCNSFPPPKKFLQCLLYVYPEIKTFKPSPLHYYNENYLTRGARIFSVVQHGMDSKPSHLKNTCKNSAVFDMHRSTLPSVMLFWKCNAGCHCDLHDDYYRK